jgi:hypothetical protein
LTFVFRKYDPPLYFITFNTCRRKKLLANNRVHKKFVEFAEAGVERGMSIGRYVLMPDQFICSPGVVSISL